MRSETNNKAGRTDRETEREGDDRVREVKIILTSSLAQTLEPGGNC